MDWNQFTKQLKIMQDNLAKGIKLDLLLKMESAALRFVDDNFRNQSWEGQAWQASDGTILVKSGTLRRGFDSAVSPGQVKITNAVPYAKPHNEGFEGDVTIPEHERAQYKSLKGGKKKKTGTGRVKSHKRKMKLPKRQYAPYEGHESPSLNKIVSTAIQTETLKILKP